MTAPRTHPLADATAATAPPEGATTPVRCKACGHVKIPARYCANPDCGHLEEFHAFNTKGTARTACSHHEGVRNTPCPCKAFTPESREETSQ
jgi:uncharacterized OB-fold protein